MDYRGIGEEMYSVRLMKREIKSRETIDRFIGSSSTVRLGLISEDEPYVVPLNFVYTDGTVYFHCAGEGRKFDALSTGTRICLEFDVTHGIDVPGADTFYTSVIAWGNPRILQDRSLKKRALAMLTEKYLGEERRITDTMADGTCIVSVKLDTVTGKENRG